MPRPHRTIFLSAAAAALAISSASPAVAQSQARFEISANVGVLSGGTSFTESDSFPVNAETETVTANHGTKTPVGFNAGGAVRIVPQLWIGVQYAAADSKSDVSIAASVPHPLLFNAPRAVQGTATGVAHNENNVHVDLMYALPVRAMDVRVMAGPTFFTVKQDFVASIAVNETYPFDTASFASATMNRAAKSAVGFNAGADVSYPLSPHFGVGALVRYSRGNVKFDQAALKAGGLEAGGGVRIRF
jgi:opacity protein-like surface antigen